MPGPDRKQGLYENMCRPSTEGSEYSTVYSGYSAHIYSGLSDIVVTFPGTKYIYSIIFRSDIVANRIQCTPDIVAKFKVAIRI